MSGVRKTERRRARKQDRKKWQEKKKLYKEEKSCPRFTADSGCRCDRDRIPSNSQRSWTKKEWRGKPRKKDGVPEPLVGWETEAIQLAIGLTRKSGSGNEKL